MSGTRADSDTRYWGPVDVHVGCHGVSIDARAPRHGNSWTCAGCLDGFPEEDLTAGEPGFPGGPGKFPPPHQRRVRSDEQARTTLGDVAGLVGLDTRSDVVADALWAVTNRDGPSRYLDEMVAAGLIEIARLLTVRNAAAAASAAVAALTELRVDGTPFFSEAALSPLIGKDDARTVLNAARAAAAATAATAQPAAEESP